MRETFEYKPAVLPLTLKFKGNTAVPFTLHQIDEQVRSNMKILFDSAATRIWEK